METVVIGRVIEHPIIAELLAEIVADNYTCNCDDYEACDYDAD